MNDYMPRTFGDSFIHVSQIDAFVDSSRPLCELPKPENREMHVAIAKNVAGLIEDGAVIQTGIGGIPDAVLPFLLDRKDLGVHSELVSDSVIPLIEAGVITGAAPAALSTYATPGMFYASFCFKASKKRGQDR